MNIDLIQCFNNYNQPSLFTGENQIYCNTCKCQNNASYINNYYSFPPILIIVLNRVKDNKFKCEYIDNDSEDCKFFKMLVPLIPQLQKLNFGQKLFSKLLIQYPKFSLSKSFS